MGRSKSKSSPGSKEITRPTGTPKTIAAMTTPSKSGTKRPLPEESGSELDDVDLLPPNGFLKGKKRKFAITKDTSAEDLSPDETEDSEEDEEAGVDLDQDQDVDDEDEDEDDEDDEDEDDEDDDEDEDDDDEDDEDDDEGAENETKTKKSIQNVVSPKLNSNQMASVKTLHAQSGNEVKKTTTFKQPDVDQGPLTHFLIPNPPQNIAQLKKVLNDRGISVERLDTLNLRVAIASVTGNKNVQPLVSGEKPLSVDGNTVHCIRLQGHTDAIASLSQGRSGDALFISGIPKFVTMEMLLAKLPQGCQPVSQKYLTQGHRNKHANAAFFNFSSKSDAANAFSALSNVKFGDRTIRVSYTQSREPPNTEKNLPVQFQIRVLNAPQDATVEQLLSLFTGATKAQKTKEGAFYIDFPNEETLHTAVAGQKVLNKSVLKVAVRGGLNGTAILIKNIPFNASEEELRELYPEASKVTLNRRNDGAFNGSAVLEFPSVAVAQSIVGKNVTMKGRRLFGTPVFVELPVTKQLGTVKQTKAKETSKTPQKIETPPQVGSSEEDEDDDNEEESMDEDIEQPHKPPNKLELSKSKDESSEDEDSGDDEDDDDDEEEEDNETESDGSEDEGIEDASDEEMPMQKSHKGKQHGAKNKKEHSAGFGGNRGRGFSPRGRSFRGGGNRGGSPRGARGGGFKHRGGGGGGGDRGRGNFHRGRGNKRGNRG